MELKYRYYRDGMEDVKIAKEVKRVKFKEKIKNFSGGSIYRMNASSADCYAFYYTEDKKDWGGGWDWTTSLVDTSATHLYVFSLDKFFIL